MQVQIRADTVWGTATEIKTLLEDRGEIRDAGIKISQSVERGPIEATILVATIAAIGTGLAALIQGFLAIAAGSKARKIIIKGQNGRSIEFPANMSPEKVEQLIKQVHELDSPQISLQ